MAGYCSRKKNTILVTSGNVSPPLGVVSKSLEPRNAQTKGSWFKKIQHHFDIDAHRLARPYPYPFYSTSWTDYISQPLQIQPLTIAAFSPSQPPQLTHAELLNLPVGHARNVGIGFQRGLIRFTVKADAIRRGICLGEDIRGVNPFLHVILSYHIYILYAGKDWSIWPKITFWYHTYMGREWKARNYGMESDHEGVYVGRKRYTIQSRIKRWNLGTGT